MIRDLSGGVLGSFEAWLLMRGLLGSVESLVEHLASVEGADSVVPKNLLRFSIGIEPARELIQDLEQVLRTLGSL